MRFYQGTSAQASKWIILALVLAFSSTSTAFVVASHSARVATQAPPRIDASIFSYDGHDFVRTSTTLLTQDGKSAVNTKLDPNSPAYKALVQKHSYTGSATVFGRAYDANYAPLTGADSKLTGALFVGVAK
jgi:cache 3/cache 2 fusion protein